MSDLSMELREIIANAIRRENEGKITVAPWSVMYSPLYAGRDVQIFYGLSGIVNWNLPKDDNMFIYCNDDGIAFEKSEDALLVLAAPKLNHAVVELAHELALVEEKLASARAYIASKNRRNTYEVDDTVMFIGDSGNVLVGEVESWGVEHVTSEVHYTLSGERGNTIMGVQQSRVLCLYDEGNEHHTMYRSKNWSMD